MEYSIDSAFSIAQTHPLIVPPFRNPTRSAHCHWRRHGNHQALPIESLSSTSNNAPEDANRRTSPSRSQRMPPTPFGCLNHRPTANSCDGVGIVSTRPPTIRDADLAFIKLLRSRCIPKKKLPGSVYISRILSAHRLVKIGTTGSNGHIRTHQLLKSCHYNLLRLELVETELRIVSIFRFRLESLAHRMHLIKLRPLTCACGQIHVGFKKEIFELDECDAVDTVQMLHTVIDYLYGDDGELLPYWKRKLDKFESWGPPGESTPERIRRWAKFFTFDPATVLQALPSSPKPMTTWSAQIPIIFASKSAACYQPPSGSSSAFELEEHIRIPPAQSSRFNGFPNQRHRAKKLFSAEREADSHSPFELLQLIQKHCDWSNPWHVAFICIGFPWASFLAYVFIVITFASLIAPGLRSPLRRLLCQAVQT